MQPYSAFTLKEASALSLNVRAHSFEASRCASSSSLRRLDAKVEHGIRMARPDSKDCSLSESSRIPLIAKANCGSQETSSCAGGQSRSEPGQDE